MKYNKINKTNIEVSEFALGTWPFAGGDEWGYQDDQDSINAVNESINNGINFFDTAPGYGDGRSERVLGKAIKNKRGSNVLSTKVPASELHPDNLRKSCEFSLNNLQTHYIDVYHIHWPSRKSSGSKILLEPNNKNEVDINDTVDELNKLYDEGKIRSIAVSNFGKKDFEEISSLTHVVANQLPYNGFWRAIEYEIQEICIEKKSGIICYSPLAQGLLTGRYNHPDEVPYGVSRSRLFSKDRSPMAIHKDIGCEKILFNTISKLKILSKENDISMAIMSLGWLKTRMGILSILIGCRNIEEVNLNVPAFNYNPKKELNEKISALTEDIKIYVGKNPDMWSAESAYR